MSAAEILWADAVTNKAASRPMTIVLGGTQVVREQAGRQSGPVAATPLL